MQHLKHRAGEIINGRYELSAPIGRGAMAAVFRARDHRMGRDVAIKILRQSVARDRESLKRFQREARVQEMVRHRNVAQLYGGGVTRQHEPYLVVELLRGRSLRTVLRNERTVDFERSAGYCIQALHGLAAVHTLGIHHRDLKPANMMLEPALEGDGEEGDGDGDGQGASPSPMPPPPPGSPARARAAQEAAREIDDVSGDRVVLIDFGFASLEGASKLTRQGQVVGSLSYLAPERLRGQACDERAEVYSMGIILYELLVGRPPFVAEDDYRLIHAHLGEEPIAPSRLCAEVSIPPAIEALVMACLAKDPDQRPQSANDMARALRQALAAR